MEIRARINPISYEKPLLKRSGEENIVGYAEKNIIDYINWGE